MPRPREFDPRDALSKAKQLFWQRGYNATSMRDLFETTGVTNSGMYSEFGGKRELYAQSLQSYQADEVAKRFAPLHEAPGKQALATFLDTLEQRWRDGIEHKGCFGVNTAVEFGEEDAAAEIEAYHAILGMEQDAFLAALRDMEQAPDIDLPLPAEQLAALMTALFNGLAVLSRGQAPANLITDTMNASRALLGLTAK